MMIKFLARGTGKEPEEVKVLRGNPHQVPSGDKSHALAGARGAFTPSSQINRGGY